MYVYLEFLGRRRRPNTVLAAAYDLKVFFTVVALPADQVRPADVLGFITAQRTGRGEFLADRLSSVAVLRLRDAARVFRVLG